MTVHKTAAGALVAFALTAGIAAAQSVPMVTATPVQPSAALTPGAQGATVSTITLTGNQVGNYQVSSIPLTLTPGNGGAASNLANCQAFNAGGRAISGSFSPAAGSNTISFSSPITVSAASPSTITLRCDVASGTPAGATFQFTGGAASFAPGLAVNFVVTPQGIAPGTQDAAIALLQLDATRSSEAIRIGSLPINASFTGATNYTGCQIRNITNLGLGLNTGTNVVGTLGSGTNTFTLDTPLIVNAGTTATLVLTCDIASGAAVGSSAALSVIPSAIPAVTNASGASVSPAAGGPSGTIGITSGTFTVGSSSTPGVPNTGTGGNGWTTLFFLSILALVSAGGAGFLVKRSLG